MMAAQKPMLLKDYLELDSNSDSSNSFVSLPRKLGSSATFRSRGASCRSLVRSRSTGAVLTKLSAVLNAVKNLPLSSPSRPNEIDSFARSISKRFGCKKFWKKTTKKEEKKVTVKDIVRLNSFELYGEPRSCYCPSPLVSSCSSCSDGDEGSESFLSLSSGSSESFVAARKCPSPSRWHSSEEAESQLATESRECQPEEEKEQLSPVSVMDFPYQDEDGDGDNEGMGASPGFDHSLANIESELL